MKNVSGHIIVEQGIGINLIDPCVRAFGETETEHSIRISKIARKV